MNVNGSSSSSSSSSNPKKRSSSSVICPNEEMKATTTTTTTTTKSTPALGQVIAVLAQEGWLDASEVCVLELLCRDSKNIWCSDEAVWKPLVLRAWPHLITTASSNHDDVDNDKDEEQQQQQQQQRRPVIAGVEVESYKSVFCDPRLWLTVSAEQVKGIDKWSEITHCDVECGRCGCNCTEGMCGGIPIKSEFRWEKKNQKGLHWPSDRKFVADGEGYKESGGTMIRLNRFCDPCMDRLVELEILKKEDYVKTRGETLFDIVTKEIVNATTERKNDARKEARARADAKEKETRSMHHRHHDNVRVYYSPFFASGSEWSWQEMHNKVQADDIAIVVANALLQPGCKTRHLQFDGIHYNDAGFGAKGYKAIAMGMAFNTTVTQIDFYQDWGEGCCCGGREPSFSYAQDLSKGFMLKALLHNKDSALTKLPLLYPETFGPNTWSTWQQAKPDLVKCGPTLYLECYRDWEEYVSFSDEDEGEGDY